MKSAAFGPDWLDTRLAALLPGYPDVPLCVALSGGVDSVALLAALAKCRDDAAGARGNKAAPASAARTARGRDRTSTRRGRNRVRAVHVHHGLHANADRWTAHCRKLATRLRVPLKVVRAKVDVSNGESLEAAARAARYAAFAATLGEGEILLTAHHQDDQLETVFLQLLRGAGVAGLSAMPESAPFAAGRIVRPLLTRSREELEEWVRAQSLTWIDDDTNANEQLDRNYLRRQVLPTVRKRWPSAAASVARSARHAAEAQRLLDSLARADVERAAIGKGLATRVLRTLEDSRRRNAIRFWIARAGITLPDTRRLDEIAGPLLGARADAQPFVRWGDVSVRREGGVLSIDTSRSNAEGALPAEEIEWHWRDSSELRLVTTGDTLEILRDRHGPIDIGALPRVLTIRARRGGEALRPRPGSPRRKLKALLQEARVPPSQRDRLPLVFAGETLVLVGDRWVDASVQAPESAANRGRLRLTPRAGR